MMEESTSTTVASPKGTPLDGQDIYGNYSLITHAILTGPGEEIPVPCTAAVPPMISGPSTVGQTGADDSENDSGEEPQHVCEPVSQQVAPEVAHKENHEWPLVFPPVAPYERGLILQRPHLVCSTYERLLDMFPATSGGHVPSSISETTLVTNESPHEITGFHHDTAQQSGTTRQPYADYQSVPIQVPAPLTWINTSTEIDHSDHAETEAGPVQDAEDDIPEPTGTTNDADGPNQEDIEAVQQAEEGGSIIVDSDDMASDAGYESDGRSSTTSSIASSFREFLYENGRRYHKFRPGRYNFPNDDLEQEREDMKHGCLLLLCQSLHLAPIRNPHEILDIGTGTGIWAIDMGDKYPSANVVGIDLSPIQPSWVPPNVSFVLDDIESDWLYGENHFDYIHSRHTIMAIKDWAQLFSRAYYHLRPGGWIELQEINHFPISSNNSMGPDHPVAGFWKNINDGLTQLNVDFKAASTGRLVNLMRQAGFVNIVDRVMHIPIGTWPKNKILKQVGLYWRTILLDGLQAIALGPLTRGLHWSREQVEVYLIDVRRGYHDNSALMYMPLHIVYGQKPQRGGSGQTGSSG